MFNNKTIKSIILIMVSIFLFSNTGIYAYADCVPVKRSHKIEPLRLNTNATIQVPDAAAEEAARQAAIAAKQRADNLDLLSRIIEAEAGAEPYSGKLAVGTVIMNRLEKRFRGATSIHDVVYSKGQFQPVSNGSINNSPSSDSVKAATQVFDGYRSFDSSVLYFCDPVLSTDKTLLYNYTIVIRIGNHVFLR